ncbi:hypothetical protein [Streptomyces sp. N35]|uniref:hypothetical protein n=1 Tax=Streptomyces sp. N35 TaxID=2795730 RepID=UPI0018F65678|nr:hypothetical protein [Streptomyces sp. N35]
MRPPRFQSFLLDLAKNHPTTTQVTTLADAGDTQHPHGLAITTAAGTARWQLLGQLAEGERHDTEEQLTEGNTLPEGEAPTPSDRPDEWLLKTLTNAGHPQIASVARFDSQSSGITVQFHNGARVFARLL